MGIRKNYKSDVEILDALESYDESFFEGDIKAGKTIATFNFGTSNNELDNKKISAPQQVANKTGGLFIFSDKTNNASLKGITPAVDGELFTIKRMISIFLSIESIFTKLGNIFFYA